MRLETGPQLIEALVGANRHPTRHVLVAGPGFPNEKRPQAPVTFCLFPGRESCVIAGEGTVEATPRRMCPEAVRRIWAAENGANANDDE